MDIHVDKHKHEQTMDKHTNGHMDRHRICKSLRVLYYIMTFSSSQSLERERERERGKCSSNVGADPFCCARNQP